MTAKQIAAIIESCARAQLAQVKVPMGVLLVVQRPLALHMGHAAFEELCKAIAGNAAQILAEDDESDGVPLLPVVDLDTGVTESVKVSK